MPTVPEERLAESDWTLIEDATGTLFTLPTARVIGHTLLYEDASLRREVRDATGTLDLPWRFFFATRLSFLPPLAPGIGPVMVLPVVAAEARREFAADLRERGFRRVEHGRTQRLRTDAGDRARLTKHTARYTVDWRSRDHVLDVEGWVAVWIHRGEFRLAGGAYPTRGFDALLESLGIECVTDPTDLREELLALIRAVR